MIDITNLTSLITAFRQETEQGSISPETLGSLLQAIANLLSAATTDQEQIKLSNIYDNLLTMGNCLTTIVQGDADRNNVLGDYTFFNPISGLHSAQRSQVLIKQATTERAGAMRAQQVIDLNAAKKGVATLEDTVTTINTQLEELNGYLESMDSVVQTNADNISSLTSNLSSLSSRFGYVPFHQGNIVIDATTITSPITNYFEFNMPDGHYNLIRGGQRIGQLYTYMYNNFRVFDIVGLCYISTTSFVYHDRFDHILVRMKADGQLFITGSILTIDLQNQINELKEEVNSFSFADETSSISGKCVRQGSLCTIVGSLYLDSSQKDVSAILPFKAADNYLPEYCTYYEDTMQWVKIRIYTDTNGTHIAASVPEDFMNDGEVSLDFSLSYLTNG